MCCLFIFYDFFLQLKKHVTVIIQHLKHVQLNNEMNKLDNK